MNKDFSYFIENKALFGAYPLHLIQELELLGIKYYIDVTHPDDNLQPYTTPHTTIKFPIKDRDSPENMITFCKLILQIISIIKNLSPNEKIYIHCKGGHGRCGIVVACLLSYMKKIKPYEAIQLTTYYHNIREMKTKWKRIGSPQTKKQKSFVNRVCRPIYFFKSYRTSKFFGFSTFSHHSIQIPNYGSFPTLEAAYNAHKQITDSKYVQKQLKTVNPYYSRQLSKSINFNPNWSNLKYPIMLKLYTLKLEQHSDFKKNLLFSLLSPIYFNSKHDVYWGIGAFGTGQNKLGEILMKLREDLIGSS